MEKIEKSLYEASLDNLTGGQDIEKAMNHKYFKREGTPGKYKYYYTEEEYKKAKGSNTEEGKKEGFKIGDKVILEDGFDEGGKKPVMREYTIMREYPITKPDDNKLKSDKPEEGKIQKSEYLGAISSLTSEQRDEIKKSDIFYALGDSYSENNKNGKSLSSFTKKGSELKSLMKPKFEAYEEKLLRCNSKITELSESISGSDIIDFKGESEYGDPIFSYKPNTNFQTLTEEQRKVTEDFSLLNDLCYRRRDIKKDINAMKVLTENMKDDSLYTVSTRFLISLYE